MSEDEELVMEQLRRLAFKSGDEKIRLQAIQTLAKILGLMKETAPASNLQILIANMKEGTDVRARLAD